MNRIYLLATISILTSLSSFGQNHLIEQTLLGKANPIFLNPGFAGASGTPRIVTNGQLFQSTPTNSGDLNHFSGSFDFYSKKLHGGISARANVAQYYTNSPANYFRKIHIAYAPKFSSGNRITISPAIEIGVALPADNFNPNAHSVTGLGALVNTKKSYFGIFHSVAWAEFRKIHSSRIHGGSSIEINNKFSAGAECLLTSQIWSKSTTFSLSPIRHLAGQITGSITYDKFKVFAGLHNSSVRFLEENQQPDVSIRSTLTPIFGASYQGKRIGLHVAYLTERTSSITGLNMQGNIDPVFQDPIKTTNPGMFEFIASYAFQKKEAKEKSH